MSGSLMMHQLDPAELPPQQVYATMIRAITPRPIAWVSTCSASGEVNLAPFSYFNGVTSAPPSLLFSAVNRPDGSRKDTVVNIQATEQFVVNVVPFRLAEAMHQTSAEYGSDIDEMEQVGLEPLASEKIRPPRVAQSPIQFECELLQLVEIGSGPLAANVVIGRILLIHVDPDVYNEQGKIDPQKVDSIGRMGGLSYTLTRQRFDLPPPTV